MIFNKKKSKKELLKENIDKATKIQKEAAEEVLRFQQELKDTILEEKPTKPLVPLPPEKFKAKTKEIITNYDVPKHHKFTFWQKMKMKWWPEQTYLIEMLFSNGTIKQFIIRAKGETFMYKGRMYYLRYEDSYFDVTHKQNKLMYHEDFTVPMRKEIMKEKDPRDANKFHPMFEVHPSALKEVLRMEYIKQLAQAGDLTKWLKMGLFLSAVNLLLMVLLLVMWARAQGIF